MISLKIFRASSRFLSVLKDVGLTYIKLGQPSTTLSGGEAQRIKLATYLSRRQTGRTLFILDEPTTGLHSHDVKKLINILTRLGEAGNTIVVIEHNLDVIKCADYVIDLGPEGGDHGGTLVAQGSPEEVAEIPEQLYRPIFEKGSGPYPSDRRSAPAVEIGAAAEGYAAVRQMKLPYFPAVRRCRGFFPAGGMILPYGNSLRLVAGAAIPSPRFRARKASGEASDAPRRNAIPAAAESV